MKAVLPDLSYRLIFTERYSRRAGRFLKQHPELRKAYAKTLELLTANPLHPSLRLHALHGKLAGVHAVSINVSYRVTLNLLVQGREIILLNVGDHDAVY
jgi:toxin HigB-1